MSEHETITMKDFDDDFINDVIILEGKEVRFVSQHDATELGFDCPVCGCVSVVGNKVMYMDDGRYLDIGMCCGVFTLLEVNGEDNGLATG